MSKDEAKQEPTTAAGPSADAPAAAKSERRQAANPPVTPGGAVTQGGAATPSGPATPGGAVPKKAAEDDPRAWGDRESENDHDAWLREQKPPHWG